jgi:hypothetical protein
MNRGSSLRNISAYTADTTAGRIQRDIKKVFRAVRLIDKDGKTLTQRLFVPDEAKKHMWANEFKEYRGYIDQKLLMADILLHFDNKTLRGFAASDREILREAANTALEKKN